LITISVLCAVPASAGADSLQDVVREGESWLSAQQASQERVDALAAQTEDAEAEYRRLLRQIEGLEAYNAQVRKQVKAQEVEIARTEDSIAKATEVDRQLLPLLISMVDAYADLVAVSIPYLPDERRERIAFLRDTVDRADVSAAEKFRQVLDAYLAELSYGNTIEAYTDTIRTEDGEREVNVLRLGRIGLFYQTADRAHTGRWNQEAGRWEPLGSEFRNGIYQAIRVANKLTAPSLLTVPLPAPKPADASSARAGYGSDLLNVAGDAS
ncbi:MAG: DUF3450 domain-containing protein, partial [Algiphilus sp.]